jgi:uncharacterized protein
LYFLNRWHHERVLHHRVELQRAIIIKYTDLWEPFSKNVSFGFLHEMIGVTRLNEEKGKLMPVIMITINNQTYSARLFNSPTASQLWEALPLEGQANLWGEEIYFEIPVSARMEPDAREEVDPGTIAFWPAGRAFCIFFGPTPVSTGAQPRAYSPVNLLGKIEGDLSELGSVQQGDTVQLQQLES